MSAVQEERPSLWNVLITLKIATLFGFTWVLGILTMLTEQTVLWHAFSISNGVQGLGVPKNTENVKNIYQEICNG